MTEEIDGYKDDLERQVLTLQDGLQRLGRAKDDKKTNVRLFVALKIRFLCSLEASKALLSGATC